MTENSVHIEECPLCGGRHFQPFLTCRDHYATGEIFTLQRCDNCGFRMTRDFPREEEIGRYYETPDYISHSDTHQGLMNRVYHYVRSYMLQNKARLVEKVSDVKGGRLLDIGTGTGYFPQTMKNRGWQVDAVEKSAQARAFAQEHFCLHVKDDSQVDSFADQYFDVITMWHVLEHVQQLNKEWDILHRELKDDGTLIIAVPNCFSADAQHYQEYWAAYDVPRHLWHFTPDSMEKMAQKHGFCLQKYMPMPFDGFYVSMLSEKYRGSSLYFLKGTWKGFLAWCKTVGHREKSSSIIYIFRKTQKHE